MAQSTESERQRRLDYDGIAPEFWDYWGYHFEYNYGHGIQHLATVLALLMFLAFTIDQIQQRCCRFFRTLHQGLRTKVKLWASIRHLFNVLVFKSMEALYRHMTSLYRLQIE